MVSMDYELLEQKVTVLVVKDETSGATLAYDCEAKGPSDEWVVRQMVRDLEDWGRKDVCLQSDGVPAMIALQQALAKSRSGTTVQRNSPAYAPQANGSAEKAVQDVTDFMRRLLLGIWRSNQSQNSTQAGGRRPVGRRGGFGCPRIAPQAESRRPRW